MRANWISETNLSKRYQCTYCSKILESTLLRMVSKKILQKSGMFEKELLDIGSGLPAEILANAETSVEQFIQLKAKVERQVGFINERISKLGALIKDNSNSSRQPNSILRQRKSLYLACVQIKTDELNTLLKQDEVHWMENLEHARKQADEIGTKMSAIVHEQRKKLEKLASIVSDVVYAAEAVFTKTTDVG